MTFGEKLKQMRLDMMSIVDRMNRDDSLDAAGLAQRALRDISDLQNELGEWGDQLDWEWEPPQDDE